MHKYSSKLGRLRIYRAFEVYFGMTDGAFVSEYLMLNETRVFKGGFCAQAILIGADIRYDLPELYDQIPTSTRGRYWWPTCCGSDPNRVNASIAAQRLCMQHLTTSQLQLMLRLDTDRLSREAITNEITRRNESQN